jgi:hypothetical protein
MSACSGGGGAGAAGPYNATTQAGDLYASDDFRINCYKWVWGWGWGQGPGRPGPRLAGRAPHSSGHGCT